MTDYNVIVEYPDTADHDDVLDALTGMSPVVATTTPGRAHVVLTIDADSIPSAVTLAAHHVARATGTTLVHVEAMTTAEYDRRVFEDGRAYSVSEAAERLGLTPQAIRARINVGTLPAEKVGAQWTIPAAAVEREVEHPDTGANLEAMLEVGRHVLDDVADWMGENPTPEAYAANRAAGREPEPDEPAEPGDAQPS